jgi:hypothetical protein
MGTLFHEKSEVTPLVHPAEISCEMYPEQTAEAAEPVEQVLQPYRCTTEGGILAAHLPGGTPEVGRSGSMPHRFPF